MFLIGTRLLYLIKKRSEIFPTNTTPFGGILIYLFGDYRQLPPIMDLPVYDDRFYDTAASIGAVIFNSFELFYKLRTNNRQSNDQKFGELLQRVAVAGTTNEDCELLSTRIKVNLSCKELSQFDNAVHLFPTNELVDRHNNMVLRYEKTL